MATVSVLGAFGLPGVSLGPLSRATSSDISGVQALTRTNGTGPACNPGNSPEPSSLYISLAEPGVSLKPNGTIDGVFEWSVVNFTTADIGLPLYFPSTFFSFPELNGSTFSMYFNPRVINITASSANWSDPANGTRSEVVPTGLVFIPNHWARMSTQRLAIMAPVPYGALTLQFRWRWVTHQPNGTTVDSSWTTPTLRYGGNPTKLPSIIFTAPYVSYLAGPGSGSPITIGTNFTATLGGDVNGRNFFLETEDGAGHVVEDYRNYAVWNVTTVNVTIPMMGYDHFMYAAYYLVHIHDPCGSLLYNKLVKAVYPPNATINVDIASGCGYVVVNGVSLYNGSSLTLTPSKVPYNMTAKHCSGTSFVGWSTTGGLHFSGAHALLVSASGEFILRFT